MSKGTAHLYKAIKGSDAPQTKGQLRNIQMVNRQSLDKTSMYINQAMDMEVNGIWEQLCFMGPAEDK